MNPRIRAAIALAATGFVFTTAHAVTIDGQADVDYGSPLSVQANATSFQNATYGDVNVSDGSELDQAFGIVSGGTLYLLFAGNLTSYFGEPLTTPHQLEVFIDCLPGGQSPLRADNPSLGAYTTLQSLGGLTFDAGFAADRWFGVDQMGAGPNHLFVYGAELTAAGGTGAFVGSGNGGGTGALGGGTNPAGILASIDQTNMAGVGQGCVAGSGAGVVTGVELAIPLNVLGNPTGPIRVCAFIDRSFAPQISNQVLGPLPAGSCSLGAPAGVDFSSIPGNQYFILDAPVPARPSSWGRLKAGYRK